MEYTSLPGVMKKLKNKFKWFFLFFRFI
jgi:fructose 1,6-bisphosphatase